MRRVAALLVVTVLAAGCGNPAPSAAPVPNVSPAAGSPRATPVATPVANPVPTATFASIPAFVGESAASYLVDVDHPIVLDFGAAAITWTPRTAVVVPGGLDAVRVGLMPVSCPVEADEVGRSSTSFAVGAIRAQDAWEAGLQATTMTGGWRVEPSGLSCLDGKLVGSIRGITFYPIAGAEEGVAVSAVGRVAAGGTMTLVPVYSALDLEHPSFTQDSGLTTTLGVAGTKPILTTRVGPHRLPDGSITDHAGFQLTGCDTPTKHDVTITMRVDGAPAIELASCSDSGFVQLHEQIELAGVDHAVELFATGKTKGTTVRLGEFGWREQP